LPIQECQQTIAACSIGIFVEENVVSLKVRLFETTKNNHTHRSECVSTGGMSKNEWVLLKTTFLTEKQVRVLNLTMVITNNLFDFTSVLFEIGIQIDQLLA
jgi:hypothetical protein